MVVSLLVPEADLGGAGEITAQDCGMGGSPPWNHFIFNPYGSTFRQPF